MFSKVLFYDYNSIRKSFITRSFFLTKSIISQQKINPLNKLSKKGSHVRMRTRVHVSESFIKKENRTLFTGDKWSRARWTFVLLSRKRASLSQVEHKAVTKLTASRLSFFFIRFLYVQYDFRRI